MAATSRKSRNYKEKSSMLAFGHFALPIAAVVALGMLFVGIKLFFLTPPNRGGVEMVAPSSQINIATMDNERSLDHMPRSESITIARPVATPPDAPSSSVMLAGPIPHSGSSSSGSRGTQPARNAGSAVSRPSSSASSKPTASSSLNSKWGVQVGAFTRAEGAASVFDEIKKQGYKVAVSKADSSGKTYHRVRVAAGDTKESAQKLAAELEKKGYPVAVVALR